MGKQLLLWSKAWFEAAGYAVLYGDTDSLFVRAAGDDPARASATALELAAALNGDLSRHIAAGWRVQSRLELEFEKLYLRLFLPHARHSVRGASKRYAGLVYGADTPGGDTPAADTPGVDTHGVEFVGMEVVRRDWTQLAKRVQRELYERLFSDRPVEAYLADIVEQVRKGRLDEELVYHKNLRKHTGEYTATNAAARGRGAQIQPPSERPLDSATSVTTAGLPSRLDNPHVSARPRSTMSRSRSSRCAEPVWLQTLGLHFERVIGDARQFDLNLDVNAYQARAPLRGELYSARPVSRCCCNDLAASSLLVRVPR